MNFLIITYRYLLTGLQISSWFVFLQHGKDDFCCNAIRLCSYIKVNIPPELNTYSKLWVEKKLDSHCYTLIQIVLYVLPIFSSSFQRSHTKNGDTTSKIYLFSTQEALLRRFDFQIYTAQIFGPPFHASKFRLALINAYFGFFSKHVSV